MKAGKLNIVRFGLLLVISVFVQVSCEEKTEWPIDAAQQQTVVVDAIITNEYSRQEIRLTRPYHDLNGRPEPVRGAEVYISFDTTSINFYESPALPGYYFTGGPAAASVGREYTLVINVDGKAYSAVAAMEPVGPANNPGFQRNYGTGLYRLQWNNPQYNPFEQAMYEAVISWSHLVDPSIQDTLTYARLMYYTLSTIDVSYNIFPQDEEEVWFPKYSYAIVKKYSVSDDYGAYLRALLAETEWQGSLFEHARGNLPTNITNGGLGYFSICAVLTDTLVVQ
ncbi:MAG: DUF4249 family protein [Bacteroidales bacterium]